MNTRDDFTLRHNPNPDYRPHVVTIGGGHGLSNLLRGLKNYTKNITAIVAVSDDGGGSGILRQELSMPAPGDIRNCMHALSTSETLMEKLLAYRFSEGSLAGQSFGNLLLAALNGISPSFDQAVSSMHQVLAITGQVLPVTADNIELLALFENGGRIVGESKIARAKQVENCRIQEVSLIPSNPTALPAAIEAIQQADLILLGPGSLYTSLIPNLLVPGIADALREARLPRIFICNLMGQEGETEGYSAFDHIAALHTHGGQGTFSACLVNSDPIPPHLLLAAKEFGLDPVSVDRDKILTQGLELLSAPLVDFDANHICHCPQKLAQCIQEIYEAKAIRVFSDRKLPRYELEQS